MKDFVVGLEMLLDAFTGQRSMTLLGFGMLIAFALMLARANRKGSDSRIDLDFLFVDPATGTITAPKFCMMGAFFASTFWMTFEQVTRGMNETVFGWYLLAWSGSGSLAVVMQRFGKQPPSVAVDAPTGSTTERTTLTREVSVDPQPQAAEAATDAGEPRPLPKPLTRR